MTASRGGFLVRVTIPAVGDWQAEILAAAVAVGRSPDDDFGAGEGVAVSRVELTWREPTLKLAKRTQKAVAEQTGRSVVIREQ